MEFLSHACGLLLKEVAQRLLCSREKAWNALVPYYSGRSRLRLINMNQVEHLLVVLNEEAVEIAHITDKILRFGNHDRNVLNPEGPTNVERLTHELNDLMGTIELLVTVGVLPENWPTAFQREAKKEKIYKFMEYARKQGTLK